LGRSASLGHYPTTLVEINENEDELVFKINSDLVNYAYKTAACRDEAFLFSTIKRMGKIGFKGQYFYGSTIGSPD
jgi:hypothetical protein